MFLSFYRSILSQNKQSIISTLLTEELFQDESRKIDPQLLEQAKQNFIDISNLFSVESEQNDTSPLAQAFTKNSQAGKLSTEKNSDIVKEDENFVKTYLSLYQKEITAVCQLILDSIPEKNGKNLAIHMILSYMLKYDEKQNPYYPLSTPCNFIEFSSGELQFLSQTSKEDPKLAVMKVRDHLFSSKIQKNLQAIQPVLAQYQKNYQILAVNQDDNLLQQLNAASNIANSINIVDPESCQEMSKTINNMKKYYSDIDVLRQQLGARLVMLGKESRYLEKEYNKYLSGQEESQKAVQKNSSNDQRVEKVEESKKRGKSQSPSRQ